MRLVNLCLAVALLLAGGGPLRAQWLDSLFNPDVEVTLVHPPALGYKVKRVAFAPGPNAASEELVSACIEDLTATRQIEVLDRGNIDRVLREQRLSRSGALDEASAIELGRLLGAPVLVVINVHNMKTNRLMRSSVKPEWKDSKGVIHAAVTTWVARTELDFSASIQAIDLATGRIYNQQRVALTPSRENSSSDAPPDFPSETEVRELAIDEGTLAVNRLLLPWTETRELVFYDDREYGLREAYKEVKKKDYREALSLSLKALDAAKADPDIKKKMLGRAHYNVGICHFILGDHSSAMTYLRAARDIDPSHRIFREAAKECERAARLRDDMAKVERRSTVFELPPPARSNPGDESIEDRLERLNELLKKGLITPQDYERRKADILDEI